MYTYTTPTLPLTIDEIDFAEIDIFRVAIQQDDVKEIKVINGDAPCVDAEHKTIYLSLTQEETAKYKEGGAKVQVRFKYNNGAVGATNKKSITVDDVIDKVVI